VEEGRIFVFPFFGAFLAGAGAAGRVGEGDGGGKCAYLARVSKHPTLLLHLTLTKDLAAVTTDRDQSE
jgi:hypothetical protein